MSDENEPRNPYAVGTPNPPPDGSRGSGEPPDQRDDRPRSADDAQRLVRRRTVSIVLLAALALLASTQIPPVAVVLGATAVVLGVRGRADDHRRPTGAPVRLMAMGVAAAAVVIGVALSVVLLVLRTELGEFGTCSAAAQTHAAQDRCDDALEDDLPGWATSIPLF